MRKRAGFFGYLNSHEIFFALLEFLPIAVAVVLLPYAGFLSKRVLQHPQTQAFITADSASAARRPPAERSVPV